MHLFHIICNKTFDKLNDENNNVFKTFFNINANKIYTTKEKYIMIENVLSNNFFTDEKKDEFLTLFQKIQKTYLSMKKLIFLIKFNKTKIMVENDLSLNPISDKDKNVITIYQNNSKYLFNIRELIQIIDKNLLHSEYFFSFPLRTKNPYNNLFFDDSTLYNIYFFMRFKTSYFSELFHNFFLSNFSLIDFYNNNQYLLRKNTINDIIKNESIDFLRIYIFEMIERFNEKYQYNKISIHSEFPRKILVEIMKPYLKIYFISKYSLLIIEKQNARRLINQKLLQFQRYNPKFGRKMIKIVQNSFNKRIISNKVIFNEKHISFYEKKDMQNGFVNLNDNYNEDDEYKEDEYEEYEEYEETILEDESVS